MNFTKNKNKDYPVNKCAGDHDGYVTPLEAKAGATCRLSDFKLIPLLSPQFNA